MSKNTVLKVCRDLGCCDGCCLRYLGVKNAKAFKKDPNKFLSKFEESSDSINLEETLESIDNTENNIGQSILEPDRNTSTLSDNDSEIVNASKNEHSGMEDVSKQIITDSSKTNKEQINMEQENNQSKTNEIDNVKNSVDNNSKEINETSDTAKHNETEKITESIEESKDSHQLDNAQQLNGSSSPAAKRKRHSTCVSCLGVLQRSVWDECIAQVKELMEKKKYECNTMACALSAPIATMLRERAIVLTIKEQVPDYNVDSVTSLKEAWKYSFCAEMCERVGKTLHSGAVAPLLATFALDYPDDLQELEVLKTLSPRLFKERAQQRKRFTVEFTRASVEKALDGVSLAALQQLEGKAVLCAPTVAVKCVSVHCEHVSVYLGGRYLKLSRELPQSPWILQGKRMMEGSVQEDIFNPLADLLQILPEDVDHRLKFIAAGREDVDVRCLGEGRPFAIEISDPRRQLTAEELAKACEVISQDGKVIVKNLVYITKEDLTRLKQGEETKCKTYEALCVKLTHSETDLQNGIKPTDPIKITPEEISTINAYRNATEDGTAVVLQQKTPLRVLHRRPLLCRTRVIQEMEAKAVPGHPQLFTLNLRTSAGTYVKEWCHGDLGRTTPSLQDILHCRTDILALDVREVALKWP